MKKITKNLALLLSLVMLLSVVSVPAMADDVPAATVISDNEDVIGGYFSNIDKNPNTFTPIGTSKIYYLSRASAADKLSLWTYNSVGALGFNISAVWQVLKDHPGYAVKRAGLKLAHAVTSSNVKKDDNHFNFYMIDGVLTADTTYEVLPANTTNYPVWNDEPDVTVDATNKILSATSYEYDDVDFDITPILTRHMMENEEETNKNTLSFAIEVPEANTTYTIWGHNKAGNITTSRPPVLTIEYYKPDPLSLANEPELPAKPADDVVLTYNNPIQSAVATVNSDEVPVENIICKDKTVTIDYPFAQNTEYTISVTATDSHGDSLATTRTFITGRDTTEGSINLANAAFISASAAPESGANISKNAGENVNYKNIQYPNNFDLMVYKLALPSVSADAYIEKASLVFPAWGGSATTTIENFLRLFKLPGEAWDLTSMKSSDSAATVYLSDYDAYSAENGVTFKSASTGAWNDGRIYEADITDYVNECIAAQQSYLYIAVTAENITAKLAGTSYGYGSPAHIEYTANNAPVLEFVNKSATINGGTLSAFSCDVHTSFDKATLESNISLQDANGNVVDDAEFVYASGTVSLKAPVVLDEEASYKVVVETGTEDKFGNLVTAGNSVVYEFVTVKNFVIEDPILVSSATVIENTTDFTTLDRLTVVADAKAVTSFTNNLATAKRIYVAAASYDANGALLEVSMDDVSISAGATYTVASGEVSADGAVTIKGFVWDYSNKITPLAVSCTVGAQR